MTTQLSDDNTSPLAESALRQSEAKLRLSLDAASAGAFFWYPQEDRVEADARALEAFGLSSDYELTLAKALATYIHPLDRDRYARSVARSLDPGGDGKLAEEIRIRHSDGSERWVAVNAQVEFSGTPPSAERMAGMIADITGRKRVEEELRLTTQRFQIALRNSTVVVFHQDLNLRYTWIYNPALGYKPSEVIGKRDTDIFERAEDAAVTEAIKMQVIRSGMSQRREVRVHWQGVDRYYNLLVDPLRDPSGTITGVTCSAIDITDVKQNQAELQAARAELERRVEERTRDLAETLQSLESEVAVRRQTEQQLRDLSARLIHLQDDERRRIARDLHDSTGQTLTALKMTAAALSEAMAAPEDSIAPLIQELNDLADLAIKEIRTTSYLLHPPLLDETGFVSAAGWYIDGFRARSGIAVAVELPQIDVPQNVALTLFRVLQESLTNVLRHSGATAVEVRLAEIEDSLRLSIRDFGHGIPAPRLQEFNQRGIGMGLGLAGMRERVREVGGQLQLNSDSQGTEVRLTVPSRRREDESDANADRRSA